MANQELGFTRDLYILPFDHRASFQEKLFGIKGRVPNATETAEVASYKYTIYEGFLQAVKAGVPSEKAGILADEQFGAKVLVDAKAAGYMTACPAEKSGQEEFDFEYGEEFGAHIAKFNTTFVKVLVRYNPEGDAAQNKIQNARLKRLSEYCHKNGHKFMFELLVPATQAQLASVGGDVHRYDHELRPALMARAMEAIQKDGVECDLWKIEGMETAAECKVVSDVARNAPHRKNVGLILLGRGESAEKVKKWLTVAANVPGFVGFAVGRTIFWEPLKAIKEGKITREQGIQQIGQNYKSFCDIWTNARKG